jgi:hypothetical protein
MVHRTRATITHTLSIRFVEIAVPAIEEFEHDGVRVRIAAGVPEGRSFATVVCHGTVELGESTVSVSGSVGDMRFIARSGPFGEHDTVAARAWERIEPVLTEVGAVLRWRFGMFGDDPLWTSTEMSLELDGHVVELEPMPKAVFGDDRATIGPDGLQQVVTLVGEQVRQPLAHEMWREAWNLQYRSPRSSLVIGVAAAEVGFKHLVALLVPHAESLVGHIPSPPLDVMIRKVLPDLPVRSGVAPDRLCPKHIRKALIDAVEARNQVVHRGVPPTIHLWQTLTTTREFLYLLDWHVGHAWAESLLSDTTRAAIRDP